MKKYTYHAACKIGPVQSAVDYINTRHPEWDVVSITPYINRALGSEEEEQICIVLYRVERDAEPAEDVAGLHSAIKAAYARCQSCLSETKYDCKADVLRDRKEALIDITEVLKPFAQ